MPISAGDTTRAALVAVLLTLSGSGVPILTAADGPAVSAASGPVVGDTEGAYPIVAPGTQPIAAGPPAAVVAGGAVGGDTDPGSTLRGATTPLAALPGAVPAGTIPGGTIPGGTIEGSPNAGGAAGPGELLWSADFEAGDLRGFDHTPWNQVGSPAPRIVGVGDTSKALGFTIPAGGARNEVVPDVADLRPGDDLYFGFSTYLMPGFPLQPHWQVLAQWKNDGEGSPPLSLAVEEGRFWMTGGYGHPGGNRYFRHDLGPAATSRWVSWVFHIRFSADPATGFAEVWRDGRPVSGRVAPHGGTLYPGLESYLKIGYYRNTAIGTAGTVVQDDWRIGTTFRAVSVSTPVGGAPAPGGLGAEPTSPATTSPPAVTPTRPQPPATTPQPTPTPTPTPTTTAPPETEPSTPTAPPTEATTTEAPAGATTTTTTDTTAEPVAPTG